MRRLTHPTRCLTRILFLLSLAVTAFVPLPTVRLSAQGAPVQIEDALAAFNALIGGSLTLNDIAWEWAQATYPDASLGCPQPGQSYAQVQTVGYQFLFTYDGQVYEFRVSADRTITVYCGATADGEAIGITDAVRTRSNSLCPKPTETQVYPPSRLSPGTQGYVTPPLPNNLRAEPSPAGALIGEIPSGGVFEVLSGPACDTTVDGFVWWEVNYNGQIGYTAEGRSIGAEVEYYVEPLPPLAGLPANPAALDPSNISSVIEVARLQGNIAGDLAWTPENILLTLGRRGAEGAWAYAMDEAIPTPRLLSGVDLLLKLAISGTDERENIALFGDLSGSIRLWDIAPDAGTVERTFLQGHNQPVSAVAFSPTGDRIASTGGQAFVNVSTEGSNQFAVILWDVDSVAPVETLRGHTDEVLALAFSPDGVLIATASADSSVRLWNVADGALLHTLNGASGATGVDFSPDGGRLLTGWADGALIAVSLANGGFTAGQAVVAHTGAINDLVYSPDGGLVATLGEDGQTILWDAAALISDDAPAAPRAVLPDGHVGPGLALAFNPDGTLLATLGEDRTIRLWGVDADFAG